MCQTLLEPFEVGVRNNADSLNALELVPGCIPLLRIPAPPGLQQHRHHQLRALGAERGREEEMRKVACWRMVYCEEAWFGTVSRDC